MEQRRFLSGTAAIALVILAVSLAVTPGNAQVQCFTGSNCGGTTISVGGTEEEQITECCLGDGITFQTGGGACRPCIVFGWLDGPNFSGNETNEPYFLEIGFLKGRNFSSELTLSYSVNVTEGTAGEGANADFTVSNINDLMHPATTTTNPATSVILRVDELAQEIDETFQLRLVPADPDSAFPGTDEFLLDTITVTIIDQESVTFSFPESDYSGPEEEEVITVRVRRNIAIANPVTLRIVPLNYTEFIDSGIEVPTDFPTVDPEPPGINFEPNRAKSLPLDRRDFNVTPIEITFEADMASEVPVPIAIFNDEINEAPEELFVAVLQLVDAANPSTVDFSDATLCRITDNDPIFIGFERPEYQFDELLAVFTQEDSPILIVKQDDVVSEQIFRISVTAGAADQQGIGNALFQPNRGDPGDYSLGQPLQTLIDLFEAENQARGFQFSILADDIPEGPEAFGLTIATTSGAGGQFSVGTIGSTVVIIEDNDNVTVGFEETAVTVTENELRAELCVRVFVPADNETLAFNFFLDPLTFAMIDGNADEITDYEPLPPSGNNTFFDAEFGDALRRACFNVTVIDDSLFEVTESFGVRIELSSGSPMTGIIVDPSVAVITILDDDAVTIGFAPAAYFVLESAGIVLLNISVLNGSVGTTIGLGVSTIDGSALDTEDYGALIVETVVFNISGPQLVQLPVPITDDSRFETLEENFQASLTLLDPVNITRPDAITIAPDLANVIIQDDDGIIIGFDPFEYTVLEDAGVVDVTIRLIAGSLVGSSVGVNIFSTDGSAILGQDFNFSSLTLTFDQFNTNITFQVSILNDVLTELSEIFYLNASVDPNLADRVQLNPASASVTILDNDRAVIGFDPVIYNVNEDTGFVELTIRVLQGELAETVFVIFSTRDGTAIAGIDYTFLSQQLSFIGAATQTVSVTIAADTFLEFNENFFGDLVLVPTSLNVTVDPNTAEITILDDDDAVIGFDPDSYTVNEGAPGTVTFTVRVLTGQLRRSVEIGFSTRDGTALAGFDYDAVIGQTLTFNENITSIDVTVSITNDTLWEIDEQFLAQLTLISTDANVTVDPDVATATILDDDAVTIGFDPAMYTVNESIGFVSLTVRVLQGQLGRSVTLRFNTQDGTAFAAMDYIAIANRQLVFDGTTTSHSIMVAIVNDDNVEPEEFFNGLLFRVTNATRLTIAPDVATVTITDDDVATIGFNQSSYDVIESAGFVTVTVRVTSGTLNRDVVVTLTTADGAAVSTGPEPDFTAHSVDLTFNAVTTDIQVQIAITNDTFLEFDEIFRSIVALTTADPAITLAPNEATINIINDDRVVIGFEQPSYETTETDAISVIEVAVIVQRGILRRDVVVSVFSQDGTAIDGSDYFSISQDLTFNQNNSRFPLDIQILGDGINEPVEFFDVALSTTDTDATLNPPSTRVTINDNDPVVFVFAEPMYLFVENVGTGRVCVEKIGNTTQTLRVMISGGLQAGLGTTIDQVLTFAPNQTEICVDFSIQDDQIALEDIETLTFTLNLVDILPNVTLGDPDTTNVGIMDDDELVISLQKNAVIPEAIGDAMVCINFDKAYATEFEVNALSTANLTTPATPDVDYQKINRTLTATTTDMVNTSRCFPFTIVNDNAVEELFECLTVEIFLPDNAPDLVRNMVSFQNAQSTCCIQDDDVVTIGFDPDTYSVAESAGEAFVNISVLAGELQRAADVTFSLSNGTAISPMDYQDTGDIPLQFDSDISTIRVRIIIEDDSVLENDESFFGDLATTDSAVNLNPATAEITIIEDNDEVTIGFRPTEYIVAENGGSVVLTVVVLTGQLDRDVSIEFSTSPGTATSGVDYDNIASIRLIFDSTVSESTVTVTINDDTIVEADETFFGNLDNPDGEPVFLNPDMATVTILDANDTVTIGFEQTVYTAEEGTQVEVCVLITSGSLERDAVVTLTSSDDTASSAANDYVSILEDLTFSASVTEICQNVTTLEDAFLESDETFNLDLTTTDGNVILNPDRAVVTIVSDDGVTIGLERTRYDVDEGEVVEVCAVLINGTLQREAVVTLQTRDGSATSTAPADYTSVSVDLTFDESTSRACANIPTIEDGIYELEELFDVSLTTGDSFVTVAPDEGVVGITDDDTLTIGFEQTTYAVNETVGFVEVCATVLTGTTEIAVDVQFQTRDGSATAPEDYTATSATLTFGPGDTGNDCVNIPIINDGVLEGPQFFYGNLNTTFVNVILDPDETRVIIADVGSVTIGFLETTYNVIESAGDVNLLVGLISGNLDNNVLVRLYTEDGSATAPGDYISINITLTFNASTSSLSIPVNIVNDVIDEDTEQFLGRLELITAANVFIAPDRAIVNIEDDDNVTIGLENTVFVIPESAGTVEVCAVLLDGELERNVIVTLNTSDGSAIAPADYAAATVDLTFNAINTRICVNISIVDDDVFESNETFNVNLNTGDPDVTLDPDEGTIFIVDDEVITLGFEVGDYTINEPDGPLEVCVVASGAIGTNLPAVTFSYTDGSAEEGSDYSETVTSLLFGPGDSRLCENVPIIDNTILEVLEEDFFIDIGLVVVTAEETELAGRITLDPSTSTVTIIDDDSVTIGFEQTVYTAEEGTQVEVCVLITSGSLERDAVVTLTSSDDTASSAANDYVSILEDLTFSASVTEICQNVTTLEDAFLESDETFNLDLTTTDGNVILNPDRAVVIIVSDDGVTIGLERTRYDVDEGEVVEVCAVLINGTLQREAVVTLQTRDGSATSTAPADYTSVSVNLTFDESTSRACANIPTIEDGIYELEELFDVSLTTGDSFVTVAPDEGVVGISDDDTLTIGFERTTYAVNETVGFVEVCATVLAGTTEIAVDVQFQTRDGSATAPNDYTATSATLTFGPGDTGNDCVNIPIINDGVLEGPQFFFGNLNTTFVNVILDPDETRIIIADVGSVTIGFLETTYNVIESAGDVNLLVGLISGNLDNNVLVRLYTEDRSATAPGDYISINITLTFNASTSSLSIPVNIVNDVIDEDTEQFLGRLELITAANVFIAPDRATVNIEDDDDVTIGLENTVFVIPESAGTVEVCAILLDGELEKNVIVTLNTSDGSAIAPADYATATVDLTFNAMNTRICVNITIVDDDVFESNETFNVNLNTGDPDVTLDPDEGTIFIVDDEVITLGFEVGDYTINEPDGPLEVCVVASGAIGTNLPAVTFSYTDGSAEEGSDYSETVTSLLFGPGDSRLCENVPIIDNTILEVLEEDFFIDIGLVVVTAEETELAGRITLDPSTSTVTIIDDDSVTIGFNETLYTTEEASGMVTVSVSVLMGLLEQEIEVRIFSMDGTARSPEDYLAIDTILTFGPGVTTINTDVVIVNDNADEENIENFLSMLQLITVRDNVDVNPDQTTIFIVDDDRVQIGLENTTYTVTEDGGFVEICVRILGTVTLERQAIVTLSTTDDTATDGEDYTGISEDLTFDQNTNRACVTVNITNDDLREGPEIVNLNVTTGDPDVVVRPGDGTIVIVDDDVVTIGFREPSYTFSEAGVTGTIEIVKTGTADAPFDVFVSGGLSTQTDVVISADGISETVTFAVGPSGSIFVTFTITDDDVGLEAVESYVASLELVVPVGILVDRNTTVINIEDDDDVIVNFGSPRVVVTEGDLMFMMCVVKNRATIDPVTVTIEDEEGTATRDVDYDSSSIPTTVTIPGDQNRTCFTGDIIDDLIAAEFTENFFLNIIGVSDPDVTVVLDRTEIAIMDDDFAEVRFERETYTVSEGDVVEVCVIKDLETAIPTAANIQTQDGTASSPADYIGGTFTAMFGTEANARFCQNIQTVFDTDVEPGDENFLGNIVIIPGSPLRPGTPDTTTVFITDVGVQVNDTVIGDPLLTVPIHVPDSEFEDISLCYEIHGADDEYFNLVTDECASVNAHYGRSTDYLNVVDEIAIRVVDNVNECRNISINLEGNCSVQVDGTPFTGFSYSNQGVSVRRYRNRVRVSVPNCEELTLVMWIFCETNTLQDPFNGTDVVADMIKFVVMRGLNFGHRNAHGFIGQFWNQPVMVTNYTGLLSDGSPSQNRYIINFTRPGSEPRAFTGSFYQLTWNFKEGPCLYVGNRQAGPIAEVDDPNDSVIEGTYKDYRVADAFQTDYEFGLFNEGRCGSGSGFQP